MRLPRRALLASVKLMFGIAALAALFVFINGLFGFDIQKQGSQTVTKPLLGKTTLVRVDSQRVWQTAFSQRQIDQYQALSQFVTGQACSPKVLCRLLASTDKTGIDYRYLNDKPNALLSKVLWLGGFINPSNGKLYDLYGRPYKPSAYGLHRKRKQQTQSDEQAMQVMGAQSSV